ncbi:MAG: hypothetical protein P1U56_22075, partial [Saprospiraceae bacterium]|nr:hypothetical protein [Saprospiraceae bacterium]
MYTLRYALVSLLFLFFGISKIESQVTDVDFLIQYNTETCLYEACIVIGGGSATTYPQRIQFNAQYTIVVPTGTVLTIDTLFWPKEDNQFYMGVNPCIWEFGPKEISPPTQPQHDFHTVFPNLSPPSAYDNLMTGDTVRLFGLSTNAPLDCETEIRPFINGVDPPSIDMPSGGDFSNGFTFGGGAQVYRENLETIHPPLPTVDYTIDCNGDVTINVDPADSLLCQYTYAYVWTGPGGYFSTDESPVIPEPVMPGIYQGVITDAYGCDSTYLIQVDGVPLVTANTTICGAGTVLLEDFSGPQNGTWTLDPSNTIGASVGPTSSGTATATFTGFASGTYTFIYESGGCDAITEVVISPSTSVPNASNNGPLCVGDLLQLTTDFVAGATYAWSGPNGFSSNQQNPTISNVTAAADGDYTLTVTIGGCPSSPATTTVTINNTPSTPLASNNGPVCEGENINLTTDFVPGASYSWSGPFGYSSNQQNPTISNATSTDGGQYCVIVTVNGCPSSQGCTDVTVNPIPSMPTANNDGPVCEGENINLTTDFVPGASYTWSGPFGYSSNQQNPTISNATSSDNGQYCVVVTVNGCPSPQGCTDVTVNPITSMPTANNDGPVCEGENINLTTDFVAGAGYAWSGPNGYSSNQQNPTLTGVTASDVGQYCVIVTVNGCPSPQGCTTISINSIPSTPIANNDGPVCEGDDINLTTDFVAGATYIWSGPNGYSSNQQNPVLSGVTASDAGQYCIEILVNGCLSGQDCTDVTINTPPSLPVLSNNSPLCQGETLMLDGPSIPGASYIWTDPDNNIFSLVEDPVITDITPSEAGQYCLIVTVNGCDSPEACTNVIVNPTPVTPIVGSNSPICPGEDVELFTDFVSGATYTWTGPTNIISNDQNPIYSGATALAGDYCLVVTVDGCDSEEVCTNVTIKTTPLAPNISSNTPLCEGQDIQLNADFVAGATYVWIGPDSFTSNDQNPVISNASMAAEGTYTLNVLVDGCSSPSISTDVDIFPTPATPAPTSNSPVCEGEDILLMVDEVPGANYIWSGPNGFISFSQNPTISSVTAADAGDFCVVISLNGCDSSPGCVEVLINPIPSTPTASNDGPVCEGEDLTLSTDAVAGASYAWTGPNGYTSDQQNPVLVGATPTEDGEYCVTITVDGCVSLEGCTTVTITPTPSTPIASNDGPVCEGEDLTLSTDA